MSDSNNHEEITQIEPAVIEPVQEVESEEDADAQVDVVMSKVDAEYQRLQEEELDKEAEFAIKVLRGAMNITGVFINRDAFLKNELGKHCPKDVVKTAVQTTPLEAGVPRDIMDRVADDSIRIETLKVSGLSALAGIPGGLAMAGTIPADLAQYFAHVLRIEQKLAYAYGWTSFLDDANEVDDETMTRLILFLGVMLGVGGANKAIGQFAVKTAQVGVAKTIQKVALTKTAWYPVMKKILSAVGVKLTKSVFAEGVAKAVPIVGGIVSGGLTFASFRPSAGNLKNYLRVLPQATGATLTEAELQKALEEAQTASAIDWGAAFDAAREAGGNALEAAGSLAGGAAEQAGAAFGVVAEGAADLAGGIADGAQGLMSGMASLFGQRQEEPKGKGEKKGKPKGKKKAEVEADKPKAEPASEPEPAPEPEPQPASGADDLLAKLQTLGDMHEKGLLTQEEFAAAKAKLLAG